MSRTMLRLLLILSLLFNGLTSPSAMAGVQHGDHADTQAMPHGDHHAGHAMSDAPADEGDGSCCDDARCQCGCSMPPTMVRVIAASTPLAWTAPPSLEPATRAVLRRGTPPFRPPAG